MPDQILPFDQAFATVLTHATALPTPSNSETVPLLDAAGRVLATPLLADRDQPPFDRATRDGYALRSADASEPLRIIGTIRAGQSWQGRPLAPGEAIEIMTGAPVPAGLNTVVMLEHTTMADGLLHIDAAKAPHAGQNIVPRGAEARTGATLLSAGRTIGAPEIAVAATCGLAQLEVFTKPKVAIVATGDELVELDQPMADAQIRNSNSYALAALVRAEGGVAARLAIARDAFVELTERIQRAMAADLLLLSGGVSAGKYDLVEPVLVELGAEFFFTGALIQPGKPIVFGRLPTFNPARPWVYFFGLPGNPVSTQVCFHLFVAPLLRALAGRTDLAPQFVEAALAEDVSGGAKVTRFLPAELSSTWQGATARIVGWQGSGDIAANARGNCYAVLPMGVEQFRAGETVRLLLR